MEDAVLLWFHLLLLVIFCNAQVAYYSLFEKETDDYDTMIEEILACWGLFQWTPARHPGHKWSAEDYQEMGATGKAVCGRVSGKSGNGQSPVVLNPSESKDGFHVQGPSGSLTVQLGDSVMLPCFVETPLPVEDLEVEWKRTDSGSLVHLWQNGESRPESQNQRYHERAHFFSEEVAHGNFSLLLTNVTREDAGVYKCVVYTNQVSNETLLKITEIERLIVSGGHVISAYASEEITLNCSVDSHIPSEKIEEVSWKKDGDLLVLLYQNGMIQRESTHGRFKGRVEFFSTEDRNKGNFSMRLKDVRIEDKGLYRCLAFSGDLSDNTTVEVQQLDNSRRAQVIQCAHVLCPNIIMSIVFILWGVTEAVIVQVWNTTDGTGKALILMALLMWLFLIFWHVIVVDSLLFVSIMMILEIVSVSGSIYIHTVVVTDVNDARRLESDSDSKNTVTQPSGWSVGVFMVGSVLVVFVNITALIVELILKARHVISAYAGEEIILNCSVDSHIPSEKIEEVSWKKQDEDLLLLLYQEGEILTESTHGRFKGRVEFFSAEDRNKGNFSMRLKDVRIEDKGVYICSAFSGTLSDNTTVEVQQLGVSSVHIWIIVLCLLGFIIGSVILGYFSYTSFKKKDGHLAVQSALVLCLNITLSIGFILWGFTDEDRPAQTEGHQNTEGKKPRYLCMEDQPAATSGLAEDQPIATSEFMRKLTAALREAFWPEAAHQTPPPSGSSMALPVSDWNGTDSVSIYSLRFRTLGASAGWDEKALLAVYRRGINQELRLAMATYDDSLGLEAFIQRSIQVSQHLAACKSPEVEPAQKGCDSGRLELASTVERENIVWPYVLRLRIQGELHLPGVSKTPPATLAEGILGTGRPDHPGTTIREGQGEVCSTYRPPSRSATPRRDSTSRTGGFDSGRDPGSSLVSQALPHMFLGPVRHLGVEHCLPAEVFTSTPDSPPDHLNPGSYSSGRSSPTGDTGGQWPSRSPDLNHIEHLCKDLKYLLSTGAHHPTCPSLRGFALKNSRKSPNPAVIVDVWHKINTARKVGMLIYFLLGPVTTILFVPVIVGFYYRNKKAPRVLFIVKVLEFLLVPFFTFTLYNAVKVEERDALICVTVFLVISSVMNISLLSTLIQRSGNRKFQYNGLSGDSVQRAGVQFGLFGSG
ncbi:junctional adhesion molecule-like isoform X2 [Silurus asotus]|uniref:Junctional adhesion molecule-like isoform X2 n=1 Tax=Silurus asotus TaxID=30991 RepID=A0AAD5AMW8_SILAS|nr:junctional adhesion molecule-like isoform X2 [Silurus asotus]